MALKIPEASTPIRISPRGKFEERMRLLCEKSPRIKKHTALTYTRYELFADYLIIRCYDDHITIHTNGDIDHYQVKECKYNEIRHETNDIDFLAELLHIRLETE